MPFPRFVFFVLDFMYIGHSRILGVHDTQYVAISEEFSIIAKSLFSKPFGVLT